MLVKSFYEKEEDVKF